MHDRNLYYEKVNEKMKRNINHFQVGANKQSALHFADGQRWNNSYFSETEAVNNQRALRVHEQTQSDANATYMYNQ